NGTQVANNLVAFAWGRRAACEPHAVRKLLEAAKRQPDEDASGPVVALRRPVSELQRLREHRAADLRVYQNEAYARRYLDLVDRVAEAERQACGTDRLATAVARYYYKLMAYKDEYEV